MKRLLLASAALVTALPAWGQNYTRQATPDPGQYVPIFAIACQDAQGRSLPPGSPSCAVAAAQAVQGTVTSNQGAPNAGGSQAWFVQWSGQSVAVSNTVKVDGSGVTQPVSAASLPLPTGAATAAGQAAQQGPVAPGAASANSVLGASVYNSTAPAPTNGQQLALQADAAGNLKVTQAASLPAGANIIGRVGIDQTTPGTTNGVVIVEATATAGDASITTGGTAQTLFGGTAPPNGWSVSNPNLSDDLWCSDSTTAAVNGQGSFRIAANGGSHETPPLSKPAGAVSCIGPTTGDKITARRW